MCCVDCLNVGNPEKEESFWRFTETVKGIKDACTAFDVPVVGGNVSFYNEAGDIAIYPTPLIGLVGKIDDVKKAKSLSFKTKDSLIIAIGSTKDEMGGSEYYKSIHNIENGNPPIVDFTEEKKNAYFVSECVNRELCTAAHDCSEGGIAVTIAEMTLENELGCQIDLSKIISSEELRDDELLFSESHARYILEIPQNNLEKFENFAKEMKVTYSILGKVDGSYFTIKKGDKTIINTEIKKIKEIYEEAIPKIMGV